MSVLEVHDVSIRYITGDFKDIGLKEYTMKKLRGEYHVTEFWADRNISFTLDKGEMLGIIGTNGAGKSTLLKAISGIMEPTTGYVKRDGSIAALLELASGFDGDLTVRENAYLRGAMLGYTRKFMDETYDRIIDFSGLQDFQDRPFRQLSSGMKSRLAFSIASLVQPDILILDEVLSVGDGAFRKKSEAKMKEIIAGGAATILVSHSIQQVRSLCTKVLWLEKGQQIAFSEDVEGICDRYQRFLNGELKLEEVNAAFQPRVPTDLGIRPTVREKRDMESKEKTVVEQSLAGDEEKAKYGVDWAAKKMLAAVPKTVRTAILSAFIFGMIVHLQSFSGFILNWDSTADSIAPAGGTSLLSQGKWLATSVLIPPLNIGSYDGICAILFISIAAGLVAQTIRVRSTISSALIGMVMVSFPSLMSMFSYSGESNFCFVLLLAVAAAFFTSRSRHGYIWGIVLLTLSLGAYPAYIGAAAAIFLFLCILDLLQGKKEEKEIIWQGFKYIGILLASIAIYYAILILLLNGTGTQLASYRGIDSALESPSLENIIAALQGSYLKVILFFFSDSYGRAYPRDIWCYRLIVVFLLFAIGVLIKKNRIYRRPIRLLLTCALLLLMPIAVHAIGVLGQNANTHWVMIYPFVFIFVFAIKLAEETVISENQERAEGAAKAGRKKKTGCWGQAAQWAVIGVTVVILSNWFVTTNAGYAKLKISYEGAYTHCVMIVDELMALPEYDPEKPLAVIGTDQTYTPDLLNYMRRFTGMSRGRSFLIDNRRYVSFFRDYLGIRLNAAPAEKNLELAETDEFKEMPCYPSAGFAREIDGYLVVKLSDG